MVFRCPHSFFWTKYSDVCKTAKVWRGWNLLYAWRKCSVFIKSKFQHVVLQCSDIRKHGRYLLFWRQSCRTCRRMAARQCVFGYASSACWASYSECHTPHRYISLDRDLERKRSPHWIYTCRTDQNGAALFSFFLKELRRQQLIPSFKHFILEQFFCLTNQPKLGCVFLLHSDVSLKTSFIHESFNNKDADNRHKQQLRTFVQKGLAL